MSIKSLTSRIFHSRSRGAVLEAFERGEFPCTECHHIMKLDELTPLQMAQCPKCKAMNFIPMRLGHFWLVQPVGGGGMGSVYKGFHPEYPDQAFAVKVLARSEKQKPAQVSALIREATVARNLGHHPCLVGYAASGYLDGEYFLAMEYIDGKGLDKRIDTEQQLPEKMVLLTALYVLAAQQHINEKGYLYRDLKPENIVVTRDGRAVLLDYGLCLTLEKARNPGDEFVTGSPYYLPPERLWGTGEDAFSEMYSLGMVMYYALTGQTFFDADEVESLAKKHVSKVRLAVGSRLKGFRPELIDVLTRMLKQEPEERYQTFEELSRDLHAVYEIVLDEEKKGA